MSVSKLAGAGPRQGIKTPALCGASAAALAVLCAPAAGRAQAPPSGAEASVAELIVTAQKREERLQDVPIAISLLQGDRLDRSTSVGVVDAMRAMPGVAPIQTAAGARSNRTDAIVIRGVAAQGGSATTAYYLDSIPFSFIRQSYAVDASAYDLDRVEVLRGPQGTLYGASALNGVVRILTENADPTRYAVKARGSVATTAHGSESYRTDLAVNIPIVEDKVALRAVVGFQDIGGWIDKPIGKDVNDAELANYRLKLNLRPTEDLSIDALAWVSRNQYGGHAGSANNRTSASIWNEPTLTDFEALGLQVAYEAPLFTVTSMTSYIDFRQTARIDFSPVDAAARPNSFFINSNDTKVFSQEVLLSSTTEGPLRWSAGAYYRNAKEQLYALSYHRVTGALTRGYRAPTIQDTESDAFAVFGEVTGSFLDGQLEVTGGLRYFKDEIAEREVSRAFTGGTSPTLTFTPEGHGIPTLGLVKTDSEFDKVTPRVVVNWRPSSDLTVYASYAQGFRSGINQLPNVTELAPQFGPADPDTLTNYEVGAKGSFLDGRVSVETAVYYMDWEDVQQQLTVIVVPPNTSSAALVNAGTASGWGFDLGITVQPVENLTLGATYSWNDLVFDQEVISNSRRLAREGARLNNSPEQTVGFSVDYRAPLANGFEAGVNLSANYTSAMIVNRSLTGVPVGGDAITLVNEDHWGTAARLELRAPSNWSASVFVENIFDTESILYRDPNTAVWTTFARPRTIGVQLEYRY